MLIKEYVDMDDAYKKFNLGLFLNDRYELIQGATAHIYNCVIVMHSHQCSLDLSDFNYTDRKWTQLLQKYWDPYQFAMMIRRLRHYTRPDNKRSKRMVVDCAMHFKDRTNVSGACLLAISIGYKNNHWVATVHARASELTVRWAADLIFVNRTIETVKDLLEIEEDFEVVWHVDSAYQSITSIPYVLCRWGGIEEELNDRQAEKYCHWGKSICNRYHRSYVTGDWQNYSVQKRPITAYQNWRDGVELPKIHCEISVDIKLLDTKIRELNLLDKKLYEFDEANDIISTEISQCIFGNSTPSLQF